MRCVAAFAVALALLFMAAPAWAFHAGAQFDKPPGAGGAGGLFFTGAPQERGWDCRACHVNAAQNVKVRLLVDPPALFDGFRYRPGQVYKFTATLEGEHRGLGSPRANYNSIAVTFVDQKGAAAGALGGYSPNELYNAGVATIVSDGKTLDATKWAFEWTAPAAGVGVVDIHIAAVDGNGAESTPNETLTDPFGDDVFVAKVALSEEGAVATTSHKHEGAWTAFALVAGVGFRRRRRG